MAFQNLFQNSFLGGQISPRLWSRVDLERFAQGATEIRNMVVMPHGGGISRSGTRYIQPAKYPDRLARLVRFELGDDLRYQLEIGDRYMRFFLNNGVVVDGRGFVNGTFDADISGWTDISAGSGAIAWNAGGRMDLIGAGAGNEARAEQVLVTPSIQPYTVTVDVIGSTVNYRVGTTSNGAELASGTLAVGADQSFGFQTLVSQDVYFTFENAAADTRSIDNVRLSQPIYEIDTPYVESDLVQLKFSRTTSALYIVHPDWAQRKLSRRKVNEWTLGLLDFIDGPYLDLDPEDLPATTLTASAVSGSVTVTASQVDDINGGEGFLESDNGRVLRMDTTSSGDPNWGWGVITGITSPLIVTVAVRRNFESISATRKWRLGAWSNTTGWPSATEFFQLRLWFGNTALEPARFWYSQSGVAEGENFAPSEPDGNVVASSGGAYEVADENNEIFWLSGADVLVAGTARTERTIWAGSRGPNITPDLISAPRRTTRGSEPLVDPMLVDNQLLHVQRAGRKLREFRYDFNIDGYVSKDVSVVAEDVTFSGIVELAYQQEPYSVIWCLLGDGTLAAITYDREQAVEAWHQHEIGGDAIVESISTVLDPDGEENELWVVVSRLIDGQEVRYIEVMERFYDRKRTPQEDMVFMDSAITYDGPPAQVFGGAEHLEGKICQVLADGAVHPDVVIENGGFTLEYEASVVTVGLGFLAALSSVPLEGGTDDGSPASARMRAVNEARLAFFETQGGQYGQPGSGLETIATRDAADDMDTAPPIEEEGLIEVPLPGGWSRDAAVYVQQAQCLPMTLRAIGYGIDTAS